MTYTHLTPDELVMIEAYAKAHQSVTKTAQMLKRSRQTIYTVYAYLKDGHTALEYYQNYKKNKAKCGRRSIVLPAEQVGYIRKKVVQGWTPDVIIGRGEFPIRCSVRTLYRMFKMGIFDCSDLPMKGKRKPNGHQEKRGKHAFRRSIHERSNDYTSFEEEFGHLEGDTIVGQKHKSAVITLVERLSKVIITLKTRGRLAADIENRLNKRFINFVEIHLLW